MDLQIVFGKVRNQHRAQQPLDMSRSISDPRHGFEGMVHLVVGAVGLYAVRDGMQELQFVMTLSPISIESPLWGTAFPWMASLISLIELVSQMEPQSGTPLATRY
jgi:hypothetical protein